MAVVTRLTDNFTDPTGLPVMLHGVGVDGSVGRWLGPDTGALDNNTFQTWPSRPVGQPLYNGGLAANWPTLRDISGVKVADFDGNDALLGGNPSALTPYRTVAMVVRRPSVDGGNHIFLSGGTPTQFAIGPGVTNSLGIIYVGGGSATTAPWADTLWHFLAWSGSPTDQTVVFDGNVYTNAGDVVAAATNLWLCYAGFAAVYGKAQVAEVITWPNALTSGQLALVRQAMKDRYSTALGLV
jgi:hypothetical protein